METVFNEIQHSVKNWWTSLLLGIVYIIVALTPQQLCSIEHRFQYIDAYKRYSRNHILSQ